MSERMETPPSAYRPRDLMRMHVEALYALDQRGRLVAVNDAGAAPAPRFFLGVTADGPQCWFRGDVDDALIADLEELARSVEPTLAPLDPAPFRERLARQEPVSKIWTGPAFWCPDRAAATDATVVRVTASNASVLHPHLDPWVPDVSPDTPMAAVVREGAAVSVCCSVRLTAEAHEAGVETHPAFRRRGFAALAVAEWARAVREIGVLPLYSTSWENEGSRGVARQLGLVQLGSDLHVT